MPRPIHGLAIALTLVALSPARANCFATRFSQIASGSYHYILLPAGSQGTDDSLVGKFWQAGSPAVNQGSCDETNWLQRCGSDCVVQNDGPAFYVDGILDNMPCAPGCPRNEMVLLLEDRAPDGEFLVARVEETPGSLFDFSLLGVDLRPIAIPRPTLLGVSGATATLRIPDPAPGFYGRPGVTAPGTITAFRVLTRRGTSSPYRTAWTEVARFPYSGGTTTGSATVGEFCPANDPRSLYVAIAIEFDGSVLTDYVSTPRSGACIPERWYGGGHAAETGDDALRLARSPAGELTLTWGASCVTPNYFAVYEGVLGEWTSHVPRACSASFRSPATSRAFRLRRDRGDRAESCPPSHRDTARSSCL